jgi:hypothetical protein
MTIYDIAMIVVCLLLLINKASREGALILIIGKAVYYLFIIDVSPLLYYSLAATLNLVMGVFLHYEYKISALCAYLLVPVNVLGFYLWYDYYPPDLYNVISVIILTIQLIWVATRILTHGRSRYSDKHSLAFPAGFDSRQESGTMYKTTSSEKTRCEKTHPKTGVAVIAAVKVNNWWVDWGSELIDQLTSIAGLILVIVLICYHFLQTKKTALENKDISNKIRIESAENNHELKEKLRKEIADEAKLIAELDDKLNNKVR